MSIPFGGNCTSYEKSINQRQRNFSQQTCINCLQYKKVSTGLSKGQLHKSPSPLHLHPLLSKNF